MVKSCRQAEVRSWREVALERLTTPVTTRLSTPLSLLAASVSLFLALVSVRVYQRDLSTRRRTEQFFTLFTLDQRRPLDWDSLPLSPSGDWTAGIAASSSLSDATEDVPLSRMTPRMRRLWLDSASKVGDELAAAEVLVRQAIAERPGWAYYRFLLGELVYVRMNREQDRDLALHPERWAVPLREAAAGAPGDDWIWRFLAGSYLETWQVVPESARPAAAEVLKRGFLDPDFVSSGLAPAILLLGRDRALGLVPDEAASLKTAFSVLAGRGDIEGAALVERRRESAERAERRADLAKIDERFRLGDTDGLRAACNAWIAKHSILEFDDPAGRQDVARVLERWPPDDPGTWAADPRGAIVRFFLDGRENGAPAKGLESALSALSGVPDYIQARVLLLSGDEPGAEELARHSPSAGSFEWTRYVLDLARACLRRGDGAAARRALERLPPNALGECEALIVRRDVALAIGDRDAASSADRDLTSATGLSRPPDPTAGSRVISPSEWLSPGNLSLCLDPLRTRGRVLRVDLADSFRRLTTHDSRLTGDLRLEPGTCRLAPGRRSRHADRPSRRAGRQAQFLGPSHARGARRALGEHHREMSKSPHGLGPTSPRPLGHPSPGGRGDGGEVLSRDAPPAAPCGFSAGGLTPTSFSEIC